MKQEKGRFFKRLFLCLLHVPLILPLAYMLARIQLDGFYNEGCPEIDYICELSLKYSHLVPRIDSFATEMEKRGDIENIFFMRNVFFFDWMAAVVASILMIYAFLLFPYARDEFVETAWLKYKQHGYDHGNILFWIVFCIPFIWIIFMYIADSPYKFTRGAVRIHASKYYSILDIIFAVGFCGYISMALLLVFVLRHDLKQR